MIHLAYNPNDMRRIFCWGDNIRANTFAEKKAKRPSLEDFLNQIPAYQFMPSFTGIPKPEVFLDKFRKGDNVVYYSYAGLWKQIVDWCNEHEITYQWEKDESYFKYRDFSLSLQEFIDYVSQWGLKFDPYDYQVKAAWLILKYRRSMSQLCTRAGKTLIAYIVFRYMLENGAHNVLMIVPNTNLVKQAVKDLSEYKEFFQSETVWAEGELCESSNLTIGTFQSLVLKLDRKSKNYNPNFFKKFDVICCDECHTAKCKSIKKLLECEHMKNIKLQFGFSGTVPIAKTIESFQCQALLGPMIQDIRSHELVDAGFLAKVKVTQFELEYELNTPLLQEYIRCGEYLCSNTIKDENGKELLLPKEQQDYTIKYQKKLPFAIKQAKELLSDKEYMDYLVDMCKANGSNLLMLEQMIVHHSKRRIAVMDKLLENIHKNVVVFAHHTDYLRALKEHFEQKFPDKKVFLIVGKISTKKRSEIIDYMESHDNCILCASYACCGTGLTFKNLDYGIFAQSFKSRTINLQSVGRGMLKNDKKDTFYLYDIVDNLPTGKLAEQGRIKRKLYINEKYDVDVKPAVY